MQRSTASRCSPRDFSHGQLISCERSAGSLLLLDVLGAGGVPLRFSSLSPRTLVCDPTTITVVFSARCRDCVPPRSAAVNFLRCQDRLTRVGLARACLRAFAPACSRVCWLRGCVAAWLRGCMLLCVRARDCRACARVPCVRGPCAQVLPFVDHDSPLQAYFPAARLALLFPVLFMVVVGMAVCHVCKYNMRFTRRMRAPFARASGLIRSVWVATFRYAHGIFHRSSDDK